MAAPSPFVSITLTDMPEDGECDCGRALPAGERVGWSKLSLSYVCIPCVQNALLASVSSE